MDYVWFALAVGLMVFLAWVGFKIEPHWVAKDLSRFIGYGQLMNDKGDALGRFRETRLLIEPDGEILVDQRRFMRRRHSSSYRLVGESDTPPRRRAVFLLRGHDSYGMPVMLAVRVPASSKIVPKLREMIERRAGRG